MLLHHFKTALRNLRRHAGYAALNIIGLAIGLSCFFLIALYALDELTYDAFHFRANDIYRIVETKRSTDGKESKVASVAYRLTADATRTFNGVEAVGRLSMLGRTNIIVPDNNKTFYESYYLANNDFFKVFDFKLIEGDEKSALVAPHSVVITRETAIKYFGKIDIIGKSLILDRDSIPYKITGVLENFPTNSHLKLDLLFSEATLDYQDWYQRFVASDWSSNTFVTYLKLSGNTSSKTIASNLDQLAAKHRDNRQAGKSSFHLQPLTDIHFYSTGIEGSMDDGGNIFYVYVFALVGLFILVIACINYMNLTTARFAGRAKEIAVRKVAGALRANLVRQFLSEAFLFVIIALILSLIAVKLLIPWFNSFSGKQLALNFNTDFRVWLAIVGVTIIAGLLSGAYPALYQSRLKPLLLLKQKIADGKGNFSVRRILVVFQFSLSIIIILATIIVFKQLKYVNKKDMGFNKEQLVVIDINSGSVRRSAETIVSEYRKLKGVKNIAVSSRVPGEWKVIPEVKARFADGRLETSNYNFMAIDENFLGTFEVRILKGRNFYSSGGDSTAILLNETAAKLMNIKEASDQTITISGVSFSGNASALEQPFIARVIGIVKDFNFRSLREKVAPLILAYKKNPVHNIDYFTARVETTEMDQTIASMKNILYKIDANHLFEYNFLDKQWELFYREDEKRQTIFMVASMLAILIACFGLFGLATYAAEQRRKEIGIRKVLGATVAGIVSMLSKDFLKLVLIAATIALPAGYWFVQIWLQDFAYRVPLNVWFFVAAGLITFLIALLTISFQAIKAAVSNPVKSLRTE